MPWRWRVLLAPARSSGDWVNESFRPKQMGRMTWEQAPEWVQALGKHHSELLREAIVALKRDSVDFRQMLLSVGETRYDVDRERSINWGATTSRTWPMRARIR